MILILCQIISIFFFLWYLIGQSIEDVKTMQVPVWKNDLAVFTGLVSYIVLCIVKQNAVPNEICMVTGVLLLLGFLKLFGSGDIKAMLAIYFVSALFSQTGHPASIPFLSALLISDIFCFIYQTKIKKRKRKEKTAFFPFLLMTYIITIVILIIF